MHTVCPKLQEDSGTGGLTFHVRFSVSKALPPLENRGSSHCIVSIGLMVEPQGFRIQLRNADVPLRKYLIALPS
jgi:hypothetical protein